ncbi:cleavage and polyadenylation specificity factor subunit 1 [Diaphorina citri]|uniref:Cleavage and polyadenylation specificity factor subunit 1 n=1 Tax=Diaphorina citri TaxID=121845 RepID=A0A3Q0ITI5_DIACI|nr:cleavage and polyadenylation specificity factor subunit 1 [Diaphorina citri]
MFSICKETHPATGVEHAVSCHFYNRAEKCLVVAGANIIRVFQLVPDIDPVSKTKLQDIARSPPKMKLECVSQFSLAGNVMSMQSVTLNNSERDALLLSFKEAKVSIVQYDMDTHDLKTLSLHYFEEEEMKMGWSNHWQIPIIRVDPQNRCAVLLAYGRQIVVLPFRKGSLIEDPNNKEQVLASYTIPVRNIEAKLDNIIDLQFLHGYYEPTLLILYESIRTFPGRIAVRKDTCSMVSVSLNIQQRVYPVIWSVSNLPFDCIQALPVRKPLGGTLILTNNALIYLNQSIPPYGVSLNSIAEQQLRSLEPQEGISICLEGAQCAFIDTDKVVISLKGGELYVLTLQTDSVRSVNRFHFEKSAASVLTTCVKAELVQTVTLEVESVVVTATLADPYLVLLTQSGELVMLVYKETKQGQGRLTVRPPPSLFPSKPQITTISLHRDTSSLFSLSLSDTERTLLGERDGEKGGGGEGEEYIDEDELLYGDGGGMGGMLGGLGGALPPQEVPGTPSVVPEPGQPLTKNKIKMIYAKEQKGPVTAICHVAGFLVTAVGQKIYIWQLKDNDLTGIAFIDTEVYIVQYTSAMDETIVQELLTVSLGLHGNRPLLLVRTQHELLIYQAFRHPKGALKLRFKKLKVLFVSDRSKRANEQPGLPRGVRISQMRYFSNIAGYQGVFLCGPHPAWLFLTSRGELRAHPMTIDGPVSTLAPFHNVNCPRGFLYFNAKSELRISVLPTHLSYDAPWPVRKVPLKCTPHFLAYHLETKTYCIVTSTAEPSTDYYKFNGEDKELVTDPRDSRFIPPLVSQFHVSLFSPFSWEEIPQTNFPLHEWEHVLCLKNVSMEYEGTLSGLRGYIALGTNYNYSEDVTCRGRILLFDIIEVVPEPGQPLTKNKIKMIYAKEQKGPVTAICHVAGFLVTAVGQKIYIWQLKDNDLTGIAFIDTEVYIASMVSVKNLILVGDYARSIALLRYQPEYRTLSLVARDYKPTQVYACEFVIESSSMGFMISDKDKNVVLFMYQPEARESNGGHRLIKKTDFHLGQHVNTFFKIRCKPSSISDAPGARSRFLTWYASLDGALGFFLPLPEKNYRRLLMLQNVMVTHTSHTGGLNPRAFRTYKGKGYYAGNPSRGIIDGSLVWKFLQLSLGERLEICKKIGSKHNDILDELYDIEALSSHF